MPILNSVAAIHDEVTAWRRDIHENPELLYEVHRTAALVADKLRAFGCDEIATGIGKSGVVGVIKGRGQSSGKVIGMRADMDALPIMEATGATYASKVPGRMHACGHDGHTAMLLGAAKILADTRNFNGTVVLIFQPAEEGGAGGKAMCDDGMMARWGISEVYAMHNDPGLPIGEFSTCPGPLAAASDTFHVRIEGKGAHAARPHDGIDTLLATSNIMMALQSIVARNLDPMKNGVVTVGSFKGGDAANVIPQTAELLGTVRSFEPAVRDLLQSRVTEVCERIAQAYGAVATVDYQRKYPPTVNHARESAFASSVARTVAGEGKVRVQTPLMGAEDFSFMLEERPGCMMLIGNGDTAGCHHPAYDFNDAALPHGISYWVRLAEMGMPV